MLISIFIDRQNMKILFFLFLVFTTQVYSQVPGTDIWDNQPRTIHYSRSDFQADPQFWTACRDSSGITYFGNNDGVLVYDGERWEKVTLPNNSSVRSLLYTGNGTVYAGAYNELGIISKDSTGTYRYNSLIDQLDLKGRNFENIWQSHELNGTVIFRSFKELISVTDNRVTHVPAFRSFTYSNVIGETCYVQDNESGIMAYSPEKSSLDLVFHPESYAGESIVAILPSEKENILLLISKNGQVYRGNTKTGAVITAGSAFLPGHTDQVICAIKQGNEYLLGTLGSGIRMLNENSMPMETSPVYQETQNSTILSFLQTEKGIWVTLNNGLDFMSFKTPVTRIFDESSIYDIRLHNSGIYLATNKGVYFCDTTEPKKRFHFRKIPELQGQAWSLNVIEGQLFAGHDKGLFIIRGEEARKIGEESGIWKIIPVPYKTDTFLACSYNGIFLVTGKKGSYVMHHKIKGFDESSRDILPTGEDNTFWVCHGYKGVFRIRINDDYTRVHAIDHYTDQNGFDSPFNINLFHWDSQIVFTTNTGIYTFNRQKGIFEPYAPLNNILNPSLNTRKILQTNDTAWVVQDDEVAYFNYKDEDPSLNNELFLNLKGSLNRGMESILPLDGRKVLIGSTTGLYLYRLGQDSKETVPTLLTRVSQYRAKEQKALPVTGYRDGMELPTEIDLLRFEYASPELGNSGDIQYSYILENIDSEWSVWNPVAFKEYTHLQPGEYIFKVRSRDSAGNSGSIASYPFTITPKWYQTRAARIFYILIAIGLLWLAYVLIQQKIKHERQKARNAARKSKKLLELEIERLKLTQDKEKIQQAKSILEEDILEKSKELANYTMQLVNKKDIFNEIQEDLKELKGLVKTQVSRQKLLEIFQKIHQHKIGEEYMEVFDVNFEKVHHNFFEKLKELHPKLTKRELRLCAFIKMDLTNKEISPLLNISVRGVETARYRIRKKLGIQHEYNFQEFLNSL